MHHDDARKENYISRHASRETWGKNGLNTAGFWARWLLWNKPTLSASIKDIEQRFDVKITTSSQHNAHHARLEKCVGECRK